MFKYFRRRSGRADEINGPQVLRQVADARLQMEALGRLSSDVLSDPGSKPAPEYIAEAETPSEDMWAHEQALYRAKNQGDQQGT